RKSRSHFENPVDTRRLVPDDVSAKRSRAESIDSQGPTWYESKLSRPTVATLIEVEFVVGDHERRKRLLARPHEDETRAVEQIILAWPPERRRQAHARGDKLWARRI